jgi:hypothetical protein
VFQVDHEYGQLSSVMRPGEFLDVLPVSAIVLGSGNFPRISSPLFDTKSRIPIASRCSLRRPQCSVSVRRPARIARAGATPRGAAQDDSGPVIKPGEFTMSYIDDLTPYTASDTCSMGCLMALCAYLGAFPGRIWNTLV